MKKLLVGLSVLATAPFFGCSSSDEQGIKDSREDFMAELKEALTEKSTPFTVDDEGYIRYSKKYKETVEQIKRQVDEKRATEVGSKFEDDLSTRHFRELLDEKGIRYRAVSREDGEWTYWNPNSKQQQEEISMEVVTHGFERQKGHLKNQSIQSD